MKSTEAMRRKEERAGRACLLVLDAMPISVLLSVGPSLLGWRMFLSSSMFINASRRHFDARYDLILMRLRCVKRMMCGIREERTSNEHKARVAKRGQNKARCKGQRELGKHRAKRGEGDALRCLERASSKQAEKKWRFERCRRGGQPAKGRDGRGRGDSVGI